MSNIIENKLIEEFMGRESFTRRDLFNFYRHFEPDLNEGTFGWRIYSLKNKNIIRSIKRGVYVISHKPKYQPELSQELIKLTKSVSEKFKDAKYCIWETGWLNEFSQHQASRKTVLFEVEKEFTESLYYELKDSSRRELFLNPDDKEIDFYIAESDYPVIIKKLITRSPVTKRTEKNKQIYIPQLEKILVDVFAESKLFYYLQGSEMIHIYENAINNYVINFTKLFSYAKRRDIELEIKQFMTTHIPHLVNNIIK
ncbi:MAG: hypothetical protein JJU41_00090 [Bacteroidetes bacterium]|nr:hypothetical protein [Bacteroidota bacterium]MCH8525139.1 hypothetical protein [Balneolales bacterium]